MLAAHEAKRRLTGAPANKEQPRHGSHRQRDRRPSTREQRDDRRDLAGVLVGERDRRRQRARQGAQRLPIRAVEASRGRTSQATTERRAAKKAADVGESIGKITRSGQCQPAWVDRQLRDRLQPRLLSNLEGSPLIRQRPLRAERFHHAVQDPRAHEHVAHGRRRVDTRRDDLGVEVRPVRVRCRTIQSPIDPLHPQPDRPRWPATQRRISEPQLATGPNADAPRGQVQTPTRHRRRLRPAPSHGGAHPTEPSTPPACHHSRSTRKPTPTPRSRQAARDRSSPGQPPPRARPTTPSCRQPA